MLIHSPLSSFSLFLSFSLSLFSLSLSLSLSLPIDQWSIFCLLTRAEKFESGKSPGKGRKEEDRLRKRAANSKLSPKSKAASNRERRVKRIMKDRNVSRKAAQKVDDARHLWWVRIYFCYMTGFSSYLPLSIIPVRNDGSAVSVRLRVRCRAAREAGAARGAGLVACTIGGRFTLFVGVCGRCLLIISL